MTREEAIHFAICLKKNYTIDFNDMEVFCNMAIKALEQELPWIPVSERLPTEGGDYLVTISFDIGGEEPVREVYKNFFCVLSQKWLNHDEDVIAWMPLPKPFIRA